MKQSILTLFATSILVSTVSAATSFHVIDIYNDNTSFFWKPSLDAHACHKRSYWALSMNLPSCGGQALGIIARHTAQLTVANDDQYLYFSHTGTTYIFTNDPKCLSASTINVKLNIKQSTCDGYHPQWLSF